MVSNLIKPKDNLILACTPLVFHLIQLKYILNQICTCGILEGVQCLEIGHHSFILGVQLNKSQIHSYESHTYMDTVTLYRESKCI